MSTITTRAGKGSALTHAEVDANFTNLNTDKVEKAVTLTANYLLKGNGTNSATITSSLIEDSNGVVGLGATPAAWNASYKALQFGQQGALWSHASSADVYMSANYRFDTADRYIVNGPATSYRQNGGTHAWFYAASGLAGNTISFTQAMTLDANGNLGVGEPAPDYKLDVNGSIGFAPGASVTPVDNGDVVFEFTNNTTLTIRAKGSDGTVRSATITLA